MDEQQLQQAIAASMQGDQGPEQPNGEGMVGLMQEIESLRQQERDCWKQRRTTGLVKVVDILKFIVSLDKRVDKVLNDLGTHLSKLWYL